MQVQLLGMEPVVRPPLIEPLSQRELELLQLIAQNFLPLDNSR